jgi:hypothetical protein
LVLADEAVAGPVFFTGLLKLFLGGLDFIECLRRDRALRTRSKPEF